MSKTIGIDVSQLAYDRTGVANYLKNLIVELIKHDKENEYILFFSSLRGKLPQDIAMLAAYGNVKLKIFKFPISMMDFLWNKVHTLPIDNLIGKVDVFITSDWTEPPLKSGKKGTILYDLIVYKYPEETSSKIVRVQKRKLNWVKKESDFVLCISKSTKKDAEEILGIKSSKLHVLYPGLTL